MRLTTAICLTASALFSFYAHATDVSVSSPNGAIEFTFTDANDYAQYTVDYHGKEIMRPGKLGFAFANAKSIYRHLAVEEISRSSEDSTWEQPWGEQRLIRNHYNELVAYFHPWRSTNNIHQDHPITST